MKVNANTKISKILSAKPEAIEIVKAINPKFEKLNNPILRRSLATRVSVKDAAKIGKISVNDFLKSLEENGFEVEYYNPSKEDSNQNKKLLPPDFSHREIITLDVRPIIAEGKDPFGYINKVAKKIKPEQILLILNDFEPIPLVDFLISRNFIHWQKQDEEGNYLTYFKLNCKKPNFIQRLFGKNIPCKYHNVEKKAPEKTKEKVSQPEIDTDNFDEVQKRFQGKSKEVDVRDLEMPLPMKTVLEELEQLPEGKALFVHHKRIPQFLLPELEKRDYKITAKEIDPDYTYLIIYK